MSEKPDFVPSLIRGTSGNYTTPNVRGRTSRRDSITTFTTGRRTNSDPAEPLARLPALTPSSSRDVASGTPKRVSFDNESNAQLPNEPSERAEGLKRVTSSLERLRKCKFERSLAPPE